MAQVRTTSGVQHTVPKTARRHCLLSVTDANLRRSELVFPPVAGSLAGLTGAVVRVRVEVSQSSLQSAL